LRTPPERFTVQCPRWPHRRFAILGATSHTLAEFLHCASVLLTFASPSSGAPVSTVLGQSMTQPPDVEALLEELFERDLAFRRRMDFECETYPKPMENQFSQDLFLTCPDSRVISAPATGARSHEVFESRHAGNIVRHGWYTGEVRGPDEEDGCFRVNAC
jgi:hypothetical protein